MTAIELVGVGPVDLFDLDELAAALVRVFWVGCHVRTETMDPAFAWEPTRGQYSSTSLLERLQTLVPGDGRRILGVTRGDLYVPVLTFVFGEAQLGGPAAVVSLRRLEEEFYGLPPNPALTHARLVKEAIHELGHTCGLRHCPDWRCAMASTHAVERLDLKEPAFCAECRAVVQAAST